MTETDAIHARSRADLCRFLAACYYEPSELFVEEKLFESMATAASAIAPALGTSAVRLGELFVAEGQEKLLIDYTRLFIGPNEVIAPPYGSVWLDRERTLMQESTLDVLELYRQGGFDLSETFRELPDHVAAELEFLYLLIHRDARSRAAGNSQDAEAARALRERFLGAHLGRWVVPFSEAVRAGAESSFYRELASLTRAFIELMMRQPPFPPQ